MRPSVTRASSRPRKPEIVRRVVVLPAPLVPSSATTLPRATFSDTRCTAVTTRWYATSSRSTASSGAAGAMGTVTRSSGARVLLERPQQEIVLDAAPDAHQPLGLVEQEQDHHQAEGGVVHGEDRRGPRGRGGQDRHQPLDQVRKQWHE